MLLLCCHVPPSALITKCCAQQVHSVANWLRVTRARQVCWMEETLSRGNIHLGERDAVPRNMCCHAAMFVPLPCMQVLQPSQPPVYSCICRYKLHTRPLQQLTRHTCPAVSLAGCLAAGGAPYLCHAGALAEHKHSLRQEQAAWQRVRRLGAWASPAAQP